MKLPEIERLRVYEPSEGDVIVITADREISMETAERISEQLQACFPKNKCLIVPKGLQLSVVNPQENVPIHIQA